MNRCYGCDEEILSWMACLSRTLPTKLKVPALRGGRVREEAKPTRGRVPAFLKFLFASFASLRYAGGFGISQALHAPIIVANWRLLCGRGRWLLHVRVRDLLR